MENEEIRFTNAQDYWNYDFDDNFGFFAKEIKKHVEGVERAEPGGAMHIDFDSLIFKKIKRLFKYYDCLIISPEEEKLYGEINGERFYIKDGYHEDPNYPDA